MQYKLLETRGKMLNNDNSKYFCVPGTVVSNLHIFNPHSIFIVIVVSILQMGMLRQKGKKLTWSKTTSKCKT